MIDRESSNGSSFPDEWFEDYDEEYGMEVATDPSVYDLELRQRAASEADFDYFKESRTLEPKREIGRYVLDQGFRVPLIEDLSDWQRAFDADRAMIRSELEQDYDGLSGLLSSLRIVRDEWFVGGTSAVYAVRNNLEQVSIEGGEAYRRRLKDLILEGLRGGQLHPIDFMCEHQGYRGWASQLQSVAEDAAGCGQSLYTRFNFPSASLWRYVEGTNVSVFGDPNVEGRYHFGVLPADEGDNWPAIGGYLVDSGQYDSPQYFRKHSQPFIARPYIELYEEIRRLPLFDTTQAPVMELQKDAGGELHFLQYLKTGLPYWPSEAFDLPRSEEALYLSNVRGATPKAGQAMRFFISPRLLTEGMRHQGIFYDATYHNRLAIQLGASRLADLVLHEFYISFQDNHFESSPICRPPLAGGLDGAAEKTDRRLLDHLQAIFTSEQRRFFDQEARRSVGYFDITVTANGREMAIESDWQLREADYSSLA